MMCRICCCRKTFAKKYHKVPCDAMFVGICSFLCQNEKIYQPICKAACILMAEVAMAVVVQSLKRSYGIMFRSVFNVTNAWRVRMVALGCIVLFVGIGSQVLVNALAATTGPETNTVKVTASTFSGRMVDGNWSYAGACIVSPDQFPLGSIIALYDPDGSFNRQCIAEDSDQTITNGQISLIMPGDALATQRWGTKYLIVRVLRIGWGKNGPPPPAILIVPVLHSHYPRTHQ